MILMFTKIEYTDLCAVLTCIALSQKIFLKLKCTKYTYLFAQIFIFV